MYILLIWLIAPVVQIYLSALRINGRIILPIIGSTVLSWVLGIVSTAIFIHYFIQTPSSRCGLVSVSLLFGGICIDGVIALFIGIFSYIFFLIKTKNDRKQQLPVTG